MEDKWINDKDDRNMMMGSSSSDQGKMVIKIKIPKVQETTVMEGERSFTKDVIGKRVCLECNKEFSSGKALGGHMRVHVQAANKNPNFLKPLKKFKKTGYQDSNNGVQKPYYMNSVNEEGEPTCSLCGKSFPSMKSLFGHMRCHPERDWRGILPPPNIINTTVRRRTVEGGGDGDEVVDLMKFLRGWSVTDRRGRKAVKEVDEDEDLLGAVEDLLSLANGGGSMAESTNIINENRNSPSVGKGKAVIMEEEEDDEADDEQLLVNSKCKKVKKRKKMKLMMELEQQQQQEQEEQEGVNVTECYKYKCTTCNKCFATHQALGGHRSSHNKSKITIVDHHQIQEDEQESCVMMMMIKSGENLEKGLHQCKICNKVFATGQALGGHKRCHWTGATEAEAQAQAPSSQITSTGEGGSSGRKVLDFDLNEIPQVMMEEESAADANGYECGYGYDSSSYNSSYN